MSIQTQIQPAVAIETSLTLLDTVEATQTSLGVLGTELSGSFQTQIALINTGMLGDKGEKGDKGDKGDPGSASPFYRHDQGTAESTWVINHNLGYRTAINVYSVGSQLMLANIVHITDNQAQVLFDGPVAGYAICS